MILDPDELASIRADNRTVMEETYPDACRVVRTTARVRSTDNPDQYQPGEDTTEDYLPCRYRVSNSQDRFLAGKPGDVSLFTVIVPAGCDVKSDDRLTIFEKGNDPELVLKIVTVMVMSNALKWKLICAQNVQP